MSVHVEVERSIRSVMGSNIFCMNIEERIERIEQRNKRVETEKAWETSGTRKICIAACTYVVMVCVMYVLYNETPYTSALIPTLGFLLSTTTFSSIKRVWIAKKLK